MYSREETAQLKRAFWTTFGQYLRPLSGADGGEVNWLNYKTGHRGLYFRMDADNKQAMIAIVMSQKNADLRALYFEQFEELRSALHGFLEEEWQWDAEYFETSGQAQARIFVSLAHVNILRKEDWPQMISFFKPRIMALDEFWSLAKYHFDPLLSL